MALRWTRSKALMSLAKYGDQDGAANSSIGLRYIRMSLAAVEGVGLQKERLIRNSIELAFFVIDTICRSHLRSEEIIMPKSL